MGRAGVLLIDDDADIRGAVRLALEIEGYEVELASNGRDAWQRLHARPPPGLILLDVMMPVMDGAEFLRLLRQDPALRGVPVVLITAFGAGTRAAALAPDAQGWLPKPLELDDLLAVVARHCSRAP